jgi:hypothetical protein
MMRSLHIFFGIGSAIVSLLAQVSVVQAQAAPNPVPLWDEPEPVEESPSTSTSSLGGPLTVTQPASFSSEPVASTPALNLDAKALGLQNVKRSRRPAAPLVDDPPQISGGFINVETD